MEYFIHKKGSDKVGYEVHRSTCVVLPKAFLRESLGELDNCTSAIKKAKDIGYNPVSPCYLCCYKSL